jgi:putative endonuclease
MGAHVYILRCRGDAFYVGSTRTSLERRVAEHNDRTYGGWTKSRRPVALVYSQHFAEITDAIAAERQIKDWSRAKKEALIAGNFAALPDLARSRSTTAQPSAKPDLPAKSHPSTGSG